MEYWIGVITLRLLNGTNKKYICDGKKMRDIVLNMWNDKRDNYGFIYDPILPFEFSDDNCIFSSSGIHIPIDKLMKVLNTNKMIKL